ncbi:PINc domain-containing protein [Mycena chlorophos]|uniref:PINc domain-containing protein n=1 Tax=Mycena chlorophos TaxID=658473 RepID=A0A8H6SUE7_MYCCL|nr:PINc domain-containing protein [Mycena chlorophos]
MEYATPSLLNPQPLHHSVSNLATLYHKAFAASEAPTDPFDPKTATTADQILVRTKDLRSEFGWTETETTTLLGCAEGEGMTGSGANYLYNGKHVPDTVQIVLGKERGNRAVEGFEASGWNVAMRGTAILFAKVDGGVRDILSTLDGLEVNEPNTFIEEIRMERTLGRRLTMKFLLTNAPYQAKIIVLLQRSSHEALFVSGGYIYSPCGPAFDRNRCIVRDGTLDTSYMKKLVNSGIDCRASTATKIGKPNEPTTSWTALANFSGKHEDYLAFMALKPPVLSTRVCASQWSVDESKAVLKGQKKKKKTKKLSIFAALFDRRDDDPVGLVMWKAPPIQKLSAEYVSASSNSSYSPAVATYSSTMTSTTDGSSASSLFDRRSHRNSNERGTRNDRMVHLKKLYRAITDLDSKIEQEDSDETEDASRLRRSYTTFLQSPLPPSVPATLRNIPTKYNIILRSWTFSCRKLLESLRRASLTSNLALEHLQDFIYYAYTFYTSLLEEQIINSFKREWLEALGALALRNGSRGDGGWWIRRQRALTAAAASAAGSTRTRWLRQQALPLNPLATPRQPASTIAVAQYQRRRGTAAPRSSQKRSDGGVSRDWYRMRIADQPGRGKLLHHLGLLSREVDREQLRGVYHFVKSITTLHTFMTSRESVLPM